MTASSSPLKIHRFAGVSLGGGKTDRTVVAILEYYPEQKRLFLRSLRDKVRGDQESSGDLVLHRILTVEEPSLQLVAFDVPFQLPKCLRCRLKCPGYETCKQPEIKWMWEKYKKKNAEKRPAKFFTPYTERCAEIYISSELEEPFHISHAMGANAAPLVARAMFLRRRMKLNVIEVFPKLSLWRMGRHLKISKALLRQHRSIVEGEQARDAILKSLIENEIAFIYRQDQRMMTENSYCFDAFICALTAFLKFRGQCEKKPAGFPKEESWIEFPKSSMAWF